MLKVLTVSLFSLFLNVLENLMGDAEGSDSINTIPRLKFPDWMREEAVLSRKFCS